MNEAIETQINFELDGIVKNNDVRILLAIESGSRAWGFESQNSDYDVRFIYARTTESYLRVSPQRDVIELPISGDLDINGWDIQKALGLMAKSNPSIMEWLSSPMIYRQDDATATILRDVATKFFDPASTSHHYMSMASKNYKYLKDELVIRKKYLYVIRPLLCIEWIQQHQTMPPMRFDELVLFSLENNPDEDLESAISELIASKKAGMETEKQPRNAVLDRFIEQRLSLYRSVDFGTSKPAQYDLADTTFQKILKQFPYG